MTNQPRTKAGREFLANLNARFGEFDIETWELTIEDVIAIEREAQSLNDDGDDDPAP